MDGSSVEDDLMSSTAPRMDENHRLSLDNIADAARSIDPVFLHTPQFVSESLSARFGCELTLKVETANPIGCFKGRGASFFVERTATSGGAISMVCASAGNFGQALAYACRKHGFPLTVFASVHANPLKVTKMRGFGADVQLEGEDFDAAKIAAVRWAEANDACMVEDGRQTEIAEGAGSIGVELLASGKSFDAVLLPLGNGALLTGVARWVKAHSPETRIIGVSSAHAPAMHDSWKAGRIIELKEARTIADGIADVLHGFLFVGALGPAPGQAGDGDAIALVRLVQRDPIFHKDLRRRL